VRIGETVVVQGAGPVGLSAVLVAKLAGASEVIVIDAFDERLETAKKLGATMTLNLNDSAQSRKDAIFAKAGHLGPSMVIEAAGALPAFPEGVEIAGNHSRYIILGLWGAIGTQAISPRDLTIKNLTIAGATFPKPMHYHGAMHLAARMQDQFPLAALVSHRFSIEQAPEALAAVKSGEAIKAVIDPKL
jgi:5-exo-hydroxycamphor dehydrogenase